MFAFVALVLFIISPFWPKAGPWPLLTLGLACMALHLWLGWPITWPWRRNNPPG